MVSKGTGGIEKDGESLLDMGEKRRKVGHQVKDINDSGTLLDGPIIGRGKGLIPCAGRGESIDNGVVIFRIDGNVQGCHCG